MACFLEHTDSYAHVESTFAFSSRTKSKDPRQWYWVLITKIAEHYLLTTHHNTHINMTSRFSGLEKPITQRGRPPASAPSRLGSSGGGGGIGGSDGLFVSSYHDAKQKKYAEQRMRRKMKIICAASGAACLLGAALLLLLPLLPMPLSSSGSPSTPSSTPLRGVGSGPLAPPPPPPPRRAGPGEDRGPPPAADEIANVIPHVASDDVVPERESHPAPHAGADPGADIGTDVGADVGTDHGLAHDGKSVGTSVGGEGGGHGNYTGGQG